MPVLASGSAGNLELHLAAYKNCDDVHLLWRTKDGDDFDQPVPDCLGFMIERQRKDEQGNWKATEILRNRVGFVDHPTALGEDDPGFPTRPSTVWPFQSYEWTDHGANSGETVRYRVSAVRAAPGDTIGESTLTTILSTEWTEAIEVTAECPDGTSAYFNRGFVMSQYIARIARQKQWSAHDIKDAVLDLQEPIRRFLSGELRLALLKLLDEAIDDPLLSLYLTLYELSDAELIDRLKKLNSRAHLILTNGSNSSGDENADARQDLQTHSNVDVHDRLLGSRGLGHNKFAILVRTSDEHPIKAWTGSTNWSPSGLCTQVNNGILLTDSAVAQLYLDQWKRLEAAKDDFPKTLVDANAQSPRSAGNVDVWFTCVRRKSIHNVGLGSDLQALVDLVNQAQQSIVYVMFQPGSDPITEILDRAKTGLYVRGVVSTVSSNLEETFTLHGVDQDTHRTAIIQPEGIVQDFAGWVKEVTRSQFLFPSQKPGIGHAITHSKMIVIDAQGANPIVITGSHNFSKSASEENDDNFVVVRGNRELSEAYAVACIGTYLHYRWRAYVKDKFDAGEKPWSHLSDKATWQADRLTANMKKHLSLWCPTLVPA